MPPTLATVGHSATSSNLTSIGAKSLPSYLQSAFPEIETAEATLALVLPSSTSSSSTSSSTDPSSSSTPSAHSTTPTPAAPHSGGVDEESQTPFYIKVRGKGKGKPIMYDPSRSSVAQVFEYAAQLGVADPVFTHTSSGAAHMLTFEAKVTFDGLEGRSKGTEGSVKEAKEGACEVLIGVILGRNKRQGLTA